MSARRPIVQVIGGGGRNLIPAWGMDLLGITITDQAGYESDEAIFTFRAPPFDPPPRGARYTIRAGWADDALAMTGIYTVSGTRLWR